MNAFLGFGKSLEGPRIRHGPEPKKGPNRSRRIALIGPVEQLILLSILHFNNKAYGAQIRKDIDERASVRMSIGALYSTLARMEAKGLVGNVDGVSNGHKRYFSVTGKGRSVLDEALSRVDKMRASYA